MSDDFAERFANMQPLGDARAHVDRILEIIEHIRLFEDFGRTEIEALAGYMHCFRAAAGTEIIREGEPGDFMLLVLEGQVEILKKDPNGVPLRLAIDGPGKTLGEMSLIDGEPRFASCITLEPTLFAALDRIALIDVVTEDPKLGVKLLMELLITLNQRLRALSVELMSHSNARRLGMR